MRPHMAVILLLGAFVMAISSSGVASSVPQVYAACQDQLSISLDGKWNDTWKDATLLDLIDYFGETGFAYAWLICDRNWLYGRVEYLPPPDPAGNRTFNPHSVQVLLDTKDDKSKVPQSDDYDFEMYAGKTPTSVGYLAETSCGSFCMWYLHGAANGYWGPASPGRHVTNSSLGAAWFGLASTPSFTPPHPVYEFRISRDFRDRFSSSVFSSEAAFRLQDQFGLGLLIYDTHIVSKENGGTFFVAGFPGYTGLNIVFSPGNWADAYLYMTTTSTVTTTTTSIEQQPRTIIRTTTAETQVAAQSAPTILVAGASGIVGLIIGLLSNRLRRRK